MHSVDLGFVDLADHCYVNVDVVQIGEMYHNNFNRFVNILHGFSHIDTQLLNHKLFTNNSPFMYSTGKVGHIHYYFNKTTLSSLHANESTDVDDICISLVNEDLHKRNAVRVVIGIGNMADVNTADAQRDWEGVIKRFAGDAVVCKLFIFGCGNGEMDAWRLQEAAANDDLGTTEPTPIRRTLMHIPEADNIHLHNYVETIMVDVTERVYEVVTRLFGSIKHMDTTPVTVIDEMSRASLKKRRVGRVAKHLADVALMVGALRDATFHYAKAAAELGSGDVLWHAAALEGTVAAELLESALANGTSIFAPGYYPPPQTLTSITTHLDTAHTMYTSLGERGRVHAAGVAVKLLTVRSGLVRHPLRRIVYQIPATPAPPRPGLDHPTRASLGRDISAAIEASVSVSHKGDRTLLLTGVAALASHLGMLRKASLARWLLAVGPSWSCSINVITDQATPRVKNKRLSARLSESEISLTLNALGPAPPHPRHTRQVSGLSGLSAPCAAPHGISLRRQSLLLSKLIPVYGLTQLLSPARRTAPGVAGWGSIARSLLTNLLRVFMGLGYRFPTARSALALLISFPEIPATDQQTLLNIVENNSAGFRSFKGPVSVSVAQNLNIGTRSAIPLQAPFISSIFAHPCTVARPKPLRSGPLLVSQAHEASVGVPHWVSGQLCSITVDVTSPWSIPIQLADLHCLLDVKNVTMTTVSPEVVILHPDCLTTIKITMHAASLVPRPTAARVTGIRATVAGFHFIELFSPAGPALTVDMFPPLPRVTLSDAPQDVVVGSSRRVSIPLTLSMPCKITADLSTVSVRSAHLQLGVLEVTDVEVTPTPTPHLQLTVTSPSRALNAPLPAEVNIGLDLELAEHYVQQSVRTAIRLFPGPRIHSAKLLRLTGSGALVALPLTSPLDVPLACWMADDAGAVVGPSVVTGDAGLLLHVYIPVETVRRFVADPTQDLLAGTSLLWSAADLCSGSLPLSGTLGDVCSLSAVLARSVVASELADPLPRPVTTELTCPDTAEPFTPITMQATFTNMTAAPQPFSCWVCPIRPDTRPAPAALDGVLWTGAFTHHGELGPGEAFTLKTEAVIVHGGQYLVTAGVNITGEGEICRGVDLVTQRGLQVT